MKYLRAILGCRHTYDNYWRHHLGCTVRITRGALYGNSGRLTMLCSKTYGRVAFTTDERNAPCVLYADMQREAL